MMTEQERIVTKSGAVLLVDKCIPQDRSVELSIHLDSKSPCLLHWGLRRDEASAWQLPPRALWPEGSRAFDHGALQTPFEKKNGGGRIVINLDRPSDFSLIDFVLYYPDENRWDNNRGRNYRIRIPRLSKAASSPADKLRKEMERENLCHESAYDLDGEGALAVAVARQGQTYRVVLLTDVSGAPLLHWGVAPRARHEWALPPEGMRPPGTTVFEGRAARTAFDDADGLKRLDLRMEEKEAPRGIVFVIEEGDSGRWIKRQGRNFYIPVLVPPEAGGALGDAALADVADEIIEREMGPHSWTLMHRFNLCYDLLDRVRGNPDALALLFVWLRFSTLRQLDWQRDYNTQPRELGHAQDRLTQKLADRYGREPLERQWVRLILTTIGRGRDAQRVRDEILHIMHRRRIKEVSGHFMEEWHQKLHNNTTPDDIALCEAFLEFLRSDGDLARFYDSLERGGITKERLEGFERPITSAPDFIPNLKDDLIQDFESFLGVLKEVHSGTDLRTSINMAKPLVAREVRDDLDFLEAHGHDGGLGQVVEHITRARRRLKGELEKADGGARELLFLDIALEDFLRVVIERGLSNPLQTEEMAIILGMVVENLCLSRHDQELEYGLRHWRRLQSVPPAGEDWALHAKAGLERLGRALAAFIDRYHQLLQPKADFLGKAFRAEGWTVSLFAEEVIRGRIEFILSVFIRRFDALVRKHANLGPWQVISPGHGTGNLQVTGELRSAQGKVFGRPTVLLTQRVAGDEEIPSGVIAVITSDTTDIVSHVAIRARNAGVLFATCYDRDIIEKLESMEGTPVALETSPAGDVIFEKGDLAVETLQQRMRVPVGTSMRRRFTTYAVGTQDFEEANVGGKSINLSRLRGGLPDWVGCPRSVAVPFGVFEKTLENNRDIAEQYARLARQMSETQGNERSRKLVALRETVMGLRPPDMLVPALKSAMNEAGLPWPEDWNETWTNIKRVWGSKWNERAYLSRRTAGVADEDLAMAVLIQEVIPADYSYVIHTANPVSGDRNEIYAEVVLGLGEALVANYPGRALSFACRKNSTDIRMLSYPSKSAALYGGALIFRSDSNGEDLVGYAGAGLYDSFIVPEPTEAVLDYTDEALVWDARFRDTLLAQLVRIGNAVEAAMGSAQDIEGAIAHGRYFVVQTRSQVGL